MSLILNGTDGIEFPDATDQATSAIVSGYVPYTNLPAGSVLQVVSVSTQTSTSTVSTTFTSTGLSATITPKFNTSKILVLYNGAFYNANSGQAAVETLYRNSTNLLTLGFNQQPPNENGLVMPASLNYLDSPATTSATTYAIYFKIGSSAAAIYQTISGELATLTLMEIVA